MNNVLEKIGGNATAETIIITDVGTLRSAFSLWQEEEAEKREKARENKLITAAQAAARLQVDISTLWRWGKMKYLVPTKVGKHNYYREKDIIELEEGGYHAPSL